MIILKILVFIFLLLFTVGLVGGLLLMWTAQRVMKRADTQARMAQQQNAPRTMQQGGDMVACPVCGTYVAKTPAFEKTGVCSACRKKAR